MQTIWEARRSKANRYRVRTVQDPSAALERLEKRLAAAEAKRLAVLHAVRVRAAVTANRAAAVARAEAARRKQLQSRLTQSLEAADVARAAHLADTAARAARTSTKAFTSARVAKQREQTQAASRLTTLLHRLKRAEASREQALVARKESAAAVASSAVAIPTSPLAAAQAQHGSGGPTSMSISPLNTMCTLLGDVSPDNITPVPSFHKQSVLGPNAGQWLRRQAAARRIQRCWRSFASKNGTTEAIVGKFVATKIPFNCALGQTEEPEITTAAQPAINTNHHNDNNNTTTNNNTEHNTPQDSPTPGCSSPTSTLPTRNISPFTSAHDDGNNSGRTAPANTPADATPADGSTPADTPRAGSPPLYGPPTPPMPVPIPSATTAVQAVQSEEENGTAPGISSSLISSTSSSFPSPRRQPVARLASSLADMAATAAAATSHHDSVPAPLPASFHASALSFDEFAEAMSAIGTLKAAQAVLRRFEDMGKVKESFIRGEACEGLLRRLFPKVPKGKKPDRYPPRAFLSAYMIQSHPGK